MVWYMSEDKEIDRVKLGLFVKEEDDCTLILKPHENDTCNPGFKYEIVEILGNKKKYFNEHTGRYYKWVFGVVGLPFEMWYNKIKDGVYLS